MFTNWRIGNFKSIREPVTLNFAPLTVISGINSSGKSTLIQSMLMVAQTICAGAASDALIFNGPFVQLGRLQDVLHYGNDDAPMTIGFRWAPYGRDPYRFLHLEAHIQRSRLTPDRPAVEQSALAFALEEDGGTTDSANRYDLKIRAATDIRSILRHQVSQTQRRQIDLSAYTYNIVEPKPAKLTLQPELEQVIRIAVADLLPSRLLVLVDVEMRELNEDVDWLLNALDSMPKDKPRGVNKKRSLSPLLGEVFYEMRRPSSSSPDSRSSGAPLESFKQAMMSQLRTQPVSRGELLRQLEKGNYQYRDYKVFRDLLASAHSRFGRSAKGSNPELERVALEERLLPTEYHAAVDQIQHIWRERLYYLGPLRDDPRVLYRPPSQSDSLSVGLKGEFTAAMLDLHRNRLVRYPAPPADGLGGEFGFPEGTLLEALTFWLRRMGLLDSVATEEAPKAGHRLIVTSPGLRMPLDLTSVGVGVSQILPTLVQALLAPPDSVLIFEQPELHLHPRMQSVLGDFFLGLALMGKQCLIETHSEHLINRLLLRVVESRGELLPKMRIYFAEKEDAATHFREVKPNKYGAIVDWPSDFFDQTVLEAERMLSAQLAMNREEMALAEAEGAR